MWKPTITHPPCTPSTVTTTSMTPSSPPKATPPQSSPLMTRDSPIPLNDMSTNSNGTTMTFTRFLSHPTWTMFCPSSLLLAIGVMMGPLFWMGPFDTIGGETQEALPRSLLEKKLCTPTPPPPRGAPYGYGLLKTRCRRRCWKGRRKKLRRLLQTRQRRTNKSQLDLIPTPFYPHTHTHKIPLPAQDSKIPWSWDNFLLLD